MKFRDFLYAATPAGGSGQGEKVYLGMTKISFQIFLLPLLSLMFIWENGIIEPVPKWKLEVIF
jgi:hypothetical protein